MKLKNKKEDFTWMILGKLGASLLGNILVGKGVIRAGDGVTAKSITKETRSRRQGKGIAKADGSCRSLKKIDFQCHLIL